MQSMYFWVDLKLNILNYTLLSVTANTLAILIEFYLLLLKSFLYTKVYIKTLFRSGIE